MTSCPLVLAVVELLERGGDSQALTEADLAVLLDAAPTLARCDQVRLMRRLCWAPIAVDNLRFLAWAKPLVDGVGLAGFVAHGVASQAEALRLVQEYPEEAARLLLQLGDSHAAEER